LNYWYTCNGKARQVESAILPVE